MALDGMKCAEVALLGTRKKLAEEAGRNQNFNASPYFTRTKAAAAAADAGTVSSPLVKSGKENIMGSPMLQQRGCCVRPIQQRTSAVRGGHVQSVLQRGHDIIHEARKLRVHYSAGLAKGRLHFNRASRTPISVEALCRLVCAGSIGAPASVRKTIRGPY